MRAALKKSKSNFKTQQLPSRLRDELIADYMPVVRWTAIEILRGLPRHIELEDLISCGVIGLMDAIEKFDAGRSVNFRTYAKFRIRGSILDALRENDPLSRSVRNGAKRLERVSRDLETKLGRSPTSEELAHALGLTIAEFHDFRLSTSPPQEIAYGDEPLAECPTNENDVDVDDVKAVTAAIDLLPDDWARVLRLRYQEDLSLAEIARLNGYSESRACQVHKQAIMELRKIIKRRPQ